MINLNKKLVIIFSLLFVSCSDMNIKKENLENISNNYDELEIEDEILDTQKNTSYYQQHDFYSKNINFDWINLTKLQKQYSLPIGISNKNEIKYSNFIINDEKIFYIDKKNNFLTYNLEDGNLINSVKINIVNDKNFVLPISLAIHDQFYYAGFANGKIIKFDKTGAIYWKLEFNSLLKTPIKIINNSIIILFNSNKIISINTHNGNLQWEYSFELDKHSSANGGSIHSKGNILFIITPNGRIGSIDTTIGEKINFNFVNTIKQKNILHNNYNVNLLINENNFIMLEDAKTVYNFDYKKNEFLLFNEKLYFIESFYLVNNVLIAVDEHFLLKSYNLKNKKLFWNVDLSKYFSKKSNIIYSFIYNDIMTLIFSNGLILEIDKFTGEILYKQNLKIKNIIGINFHKEILSFTLKSGKTIFYKQ